MSVKKSRGNLVYRSIKLLGFFLFSISIGVGLGYLLVTYSGFDIVHRKGTTDTPVSQDLAAHSFERLPLLPDTSIKNVIIFIGDGMGINQITATRYRYYGPYGRLNLERMPTVGLVSTFAADGALITDSGAGGTALSTGFKTAIGMVGVTPDGEAKTTILEALQDHGYVTGLITTSDITDATPGAFGSHVSSRKMKMAIVKQLIESKINLLVSGGETYHGQELEGKKRISVIDFAREQGYSVVDSEEEFFEVTEQYVLGVFEGMDSDKMSDAIVFNENAPTLAQSTEKAIALLDEQARERNSGFILVVEEEGVDTGSHINRIDFVTSHLKNLDDAVKAGLAFAEEDKQTLVLVVADHETGGLSLVGDDPANGKIGVRWSTDGHTGQPVPLFAFGPHAMAFAGVLDNTDFPKIIAKLMGIENFPDNRPILSDPGIH